jgi:hypothetical protein
LERLRRPDFGTTSADRVPGKFHGVLANAIDGNAAVFQDCSRFHLLLSMLNPNMALLKRNH